MKPRQLGALAGTKTNLILLLVYETEVNVTPTIPKIKGYVAIAKNKVVFLYRQSNKVTYLLLLTYDRDRESLQVGSRFYGRIYPNRCDLSADGSYFLYFAMGSSQEQYTKQLYCWTGICEPPNITAKLLFAHDDTWGGGGRFLDEETIFVAPGMYPKFDCQGSYRCDRYKIVFRGRSEDGGWTYGKNWQLKETQIDPRYGEKYPVPRFWTKVNGRVTLIKYLNYDTFLKPQGGKTGKIEKTVGEYDLHSYKIQHNRSQAKYSLDTDGAACLWADFDNYGRLIVARRHEVFIFQNLWDAIEQRPFRVFDLEQLVACGKE